MHLCRHTQFSYGTYIFIMDIYSIAIHGIKSVLHSWWHQCMQDSLGQCLILQCLICSASPSQSLPPCWGAGFVQLRLRYCVPLEQVTLQVLQSVHAVQPPCTVLRERERKRERESESCVILGSGKWVKQIHCLKTDTSLKLNTSDNALHSFTRLAQQLRIIIMPRTIESHELS